MQHSDKLIAAGANRSNKSQQEDAGISIQDYTIFGRQITEHVKRGVRRMCCWMWAGSIQLLASSRHPSHPRVRAPEGLRQQ